MQYPRPPTPSSLLPPSCPQSSLCQGRDSGSRHGLSAWGETPGFSRCSESRERHPCCKIRPCVRVYHGSSVGFGHRRQERSRSVRLQPISLRTPSILVVFVDSSGCSFGGFGLDSGCLANFRPGVISLVKENVDVGIETFATSKIP